MLRSIAMGWRSSRDALADVARDACTEALVKSGAFVVIEREQLAAVLKEQGLGQSGALAPQAIAEAGRLLGLQAIVTGKVTDYSEANSASGFGGYVASQKRTAKARVSLRVIDTASGEVWLADSGDGTADESSVQVLGSGNQARDENLGKAAFYAAVDKVVGKLVAKADERPWTAAVAQMGQDGYVYITAGSSVGLVPGTELEVRRPGEEITDPSTGQVLGRAAGKQVGLLRVASNLNEKLTVCDPAQGSDFRPGDLVSVKKGSN